MGKRERKIVFGKSIDRAITGYSLGFTFLGVSVFLLLNPEYFFAKKVSYIIGVVSGVLGAVIIGVELLKGFKIKGIVELLVSSVLVGGSVFAYYRFDILWLNILLFSFLVLGTYGVCHGLFQGIYSIVLNMRANETASQNEASNKKFIQVILFFTQIFGLTMAIVNLVKAIVS